MGGAAGKVMVCLDITGGNLNFAAIAQENL